MYFDARAYRASLLQWVSVFPRIYGICKSLMTHFVEIKTLCMSFLNFIAFTGCKIILEFLIGWTCVVGLFVVTKPFLSKMLYNACLLK